MQDVVETHVGKFWLEAGILRCVVNEGNVQTLADAQDSMGIFARLAGGKRRPTIIVISGVKSLSREARATYSSEEAAKTFAAVAIVVSGSKVARALFNFVITINRPPYPSRMFETVEEAVLWARTQMVPDVAEG